MSGQGREHRSEERSAPRERTDDIERQSRKGTAIVSDFPWLLLMIAVPAVGAAVVAALPKGRDLLAKQLALAVSLLVLVLAVLATVAFDTHGPRFQLTTSVSWIPDFGVDFALGVDGIALVMLLLAHR